MITTALIGLPTDHSVSPLLFKLYAEEHGLDYVHSKFNVNPENLEKVIKSLAAFGFAGVNITLPYKSEVISYLDTISSEAKAIGAVNTIKIDNGKLEGYNTDAFGALKSIEKAAKRELNSDDNILVFGTGGAARALIWSFIERGADVTVVYRIPESDRTKKITADFSSKVTFISYDKLTSEDLAKYSVICNATSVGMFPNVTETPIDLNYFKDVNLKEVVVFDAVFNPVTTKLQEWAKGNGAILAYGIDMMIYQGIVAFEYWTGKKVSEQTIERAREILMKHDEYVKR